MSDLSPAIEAAILTYGLAVHAEEMGGTSRAAYKALCDAILAQLDTAADTAWHDGYGQAVIDQQHLRERCERLRRLSLNLRADSLADVSDEVMAALDALHPGDLAENLLPSSVDAGEA